jgi:hypothetical protein
VSSMMTEAATERPTHKRRDVAAGDRCHKQSVNKAEAAQREPKRPSYGSLPTSRRRLVLDALTGATAQAHRDRPTRSATQGAEPRSRMANKPSAPYFEAFEEGRLSPERVGKLTAWSEELHHQRPGRR